MELLHPSLPALVQRTFAYDLQRRTLKDLQPQIADALDGFLEELRHDEIKASRVYTPAYGKSRNRTFNKAYQPKSQFSYSQPKKQINENKRDDYNHKPQCRVCKAEGRNYVGHTINQCDYISKAEKRDMARTFKVDVSDGSYENTDLRDDMDNLEIHDSQSDE